ncbi:hypothetical protein D9619_010386 [Psilocybe cf. subviscida]|uniref:Uncharacterized protein n=1 Tax=Psilocybe cf. subviscida TaxID=2480587 RepID=A0A8H5ERY0_9AGAR|nr:hypothetical protein D9619_010386 [Psilocybe cf. subviscida]
MLYTTPILPQLNSSRFPHTLPPYIGAVLFETFLYGLYVILFAICAYVLLRRNTPLHWILLGAASTMFALATSDIVYTYGLLFGKLLHGGLTYSNLRPKYWLYVTNNVLADGLLLYRCFVVWEFRKVILLGPIALLIAATVCGYALEGANSVLFEKAWIYLTLTLILNVVLTVMTAGRIWWLAKRAKQFPGCNLLQRYNATITILIESGVVYSLYIILDLALRKHPVGSMVLDAGLIQVVGIMPTLIIVQVGLGRAVHDIEANEAITRLESYKNRTAAMQVEAGISSGGAMNTHCVHPRQCHKHAPYAHMSLHSAVVASSEGVECNSSTDAIIAKRNAHDSINTLNQTDTRDQCSANDVSTATVVEGDVACIALGSLCGPTLRMDRAVSLRLSWAEEMGMSPNSGIGILQQVSKTM